MGLQIICDYEVYESMDNGLSVDVEVKVTIEDGAVTSIDGKRRLKPCLPSLLCHYTLEEMG